MIDPLNKHEFPWPVIMRGGAILVGFLAALMLNDMRDDLKQVKVEVTNIRIQNQRIEDRVDVNSNAINELKHETDYLQKVKQDKK